MSVLRDVIARFQVQVDTKPLSDLDKQLNKARSSVNSIGKYAAAGFAAAAYGVWEFTEAASHADEMLNVIQASFKGNAQGVIDWSKTMGKELGRSEYALQEFAGNFGSVLDPMFKGTDKDITNMAEQLTALSVDLASFYDTSDEEAKIRLQSGLMGETESVRKLGIDISDQALRAMHESDPNSKGQYKSLSTADKTWLRFQKILQDTTNAQGDSARTAMGWANSLKRLQGKWQTFMVEMGKSFKKTLLPLLHEFETWLPTIEKLIKESDVLGSAFRLAILTAGTLAAAFIALNLPLLGVTTVLAASLLLFEDFNVFLDGGTSVIGEFIEAVTGANDPLQLWNRSVNRMVADMDILASDFLDLAINISRIFTGDALGRLARGENVFTSEYGDDARKRAGADDANRAGVEAGLLKQRQDAAAGSDWEAFAATYKGRETLSSDELTKKALDFRREALSKGAVGNQDDVASGLVSNRFLADQASKTYGPMTADQATAMNEVKEGRGDGNIVINVQSVTGKPEDVKAAMAEGARQAMAALKEKR